MAIIAKMYIDDQVLNLIDFKISFKQNTDYTGRPTNNPLLQIINAVYGTYKDEDILAWSIHPTMLKKVIVEFSPSTMSSKTKRYEFYDVACTFYKEGFNGQNRNPALTTIGMSAAIFKRGNTIHEKTWKITNIHNQTAPTVIEKKEEKEKNIGIAVDYKKDAFVPLGIKDFNGNPENDHFKFSIEITENPADKMHIAIRNQGVVLYEETITDPKLLTVGTHDWKWDGFDKNENLDTKFLKSSNLEIKATVWFESKEEYALKELGKLVSAEVDWVDLDIQKNVKQMIVTLRINLKDGGAKGLDDWDDVPQTDIKKHGHQPLQKRNRVFKDLEKLALEGISYHWGRNNNHSAGRSVIINGDTYEIIINPINTTENAMDDVELIYNTNRGWMRSGNPGTVEGLISGIGNLVSREAVCYNVGYMKYSKGWGYQNDSDEDIDFKETSAHEIGHTIIKAYGGTSYSYGHKGSVNVVTQSENSNATNFPVSGEIDLMKYYKNWIPYRQKSKIIAAEKDVLSFIWLTKIKLK